MLNKYSIALSVAAAISVGAPTGKALAADTHVITATDDAVWIYKDKDSSDGPVIIDDLAVGDTIQVVVPHSTITKHGFVTVTNGVKTPDLVAACGQPDSATPRPLREICPAGANSNFGHNFEGTLQLEVTSAFTASVDFFCTFHGSAMAGKLSLTAAK